MNTYNQIRSSIRTGDAAFFQGKGLGSSLISWWTRGPYTHVAMFLWVRFCDEDRLMIAHANYPEGVTLVHASQYFSSYNGKVSWASVDHSAAELFAPNHEKRLADWIAQQSGRKYDLNGVLHFVLPFLWKESASRWFCSELFAEDWRSLGFDISKEVSPNQLVKWKMFKEIKEIT